MISKFFNNACKNAGISKRGNRTPSRIKLLLSFITIEEIILSKICLRCFSSETCITKTGSFNPSIPRTANSSPVQEKIISSRLAEKMAEHKVFPIAQREVKFIVEGINGNTAVFNSFILPAFIIV